MERLTVTDALDERDYLRKQISSLIDNMNFVGVHRIKDAKIGGKTIDTFKQDAVSGHQSIIDKLDRYHRMDAAITESNAKTILKLRSGREMTVAAAIALRKSLKSGDCLEEQLLEALDTQYEVALSTLQSYNERANAELASYKQAKLSSQDKASGKLTEDQVEVIKKFVEDLYGELIDPLDIAHKLEGMKDDHRRLLKELDSAIKISNATTEISF